MSRFFASLLVLACLVVPTAANAKPNAMRAEQNLAIATSVQEQLLECWSLPPGYEGLTIAVRLAFFGDGSLDGDPVLSTESGDAAGRYPVLMRSIASAIDKCVPFEGLEDLGAGPDERFDITVRFQS